MATWNETTNAWAAEHEDVANWITRTAAERHGGAWNNHFTIDESGVHFDAVDWNDNFELAEAREEPEAKEAISAADTLLEYLEKADHKTAVIFDRETRNDAFQIATTRAREAAEAEAARAIHVAESDPSAEGLARAAWWATAAAEAVSEREDGFDTIAALAREAAQLAEEWIF